VPRFLRRTMSGVMGCSAFTSGISSIYVTAPRSASVFRLRTAPSSALFMLLLTGPRKRRAAISPSGPGPGASTWFCVTSSKNGPSPTSKTSGTDGRSPSSYSETRCSLRVGVGRARRADSAVSSARLSDGPRACRFRRRRRPRRLLEASSRRAHGTAIPELDERAGVCRRPLPVGSRRSLGDGRCDRQLR
jgi:hypothetical protein